jgi:hypothetical protein
MTGRERRPTDPTHDMWQRIATKVAERIPTATEQSHAFGNYCRRPMATRTLIPSVWSATDQSAPIVTLEM